MVRLLVVLISLSLAALAGACLWDRDTLAEEARANKEPLSIIIGHFERNPPLYYQMRLDRVAKEIGANPSKFDLYDDAGVASDRLGKYDEAIQWMERKAKAMGAKGSKDDRYRYHSNIGSFYAHRWFFNKPNWSKTKDLDVGIEHIHKALEINPNAHFGREKYQLAYLEWVRTEPNVSSGDGWNPPLTQFLYNRDLISRDRELEAAKGLLGLIRLGTAWESIDVFAALAETLANERNGATAIAALERVYELQEAGKSSLSGYKVPRKYYLEGSALENEKSQAEEEFRRLRIVADKWHEERVAFMNSRLKAGRHPDTDRQFWDGYEPRPIEVRDLPLYQRNGFMAWASIAAVLTVFVAALSIPIWLTIRAYRRRRAELA